MKSYKTAFVAAAAAAMVVLPISAGQAQDYPSKPVTVTIGVPAGGALYLLLEAAGQMFEEMTGQPVIIEPKPGANTIIQLNACKNAAPDGYTLCVGSRSGINLNPFVYENLSYDPTTDLVAVAPYFTANHILMARKDIPGDDWQSVVAYAKEHPGEINYGSFGAGGDSHLFVAWMAKEAGVDMVHIPYQGFGNAFQAFGAGEIKMLYLLIGNPTIMQQYADEELKIIMVSGKDRNPMVPDVQSMVEAGLPPEIAAIRGWFGFFAPAGTPKEIVDKLNGLWTEILTDPELTEKFMKPRGFDYSPMTADEFADFVIKDREITKQLVDVAGVHLKQN